MDGVVLADEIYVTPIGDSASTDDPNLPRYLFIGDSISGNYDASLRAALKGIFNLHHPPTNCGPSAKGRANIVSWLGAYGEKGRHWDVISFNHGHWDSSNTKANYQSNLEAIITELKKTKAKLVWVTTCPVPSGNEPAGPLGENGRAPGRKTRVMEKYLNPWALEVMRRHPEISVCDQWQLVNDGQNGVFKEWWDGKDVHFGGEQAKALGEFLARHIEKVMKTVK
jgi:acyl-CoA thioesterase-1